MKRIGLFAVGFALLAVVVTLVAKQTKWAARSAWYAVSHPIGQECGYYDAYALVLRANRNDLLSTDGGRLVDATSDSDDKAKLTKLSSLAKQRPNDMAIHALIASLPRFIDATEDKSNVILQSIRAGQHLDPGNAYFGLCEWTYLRRMKRYNEADAALNKAARLPRYDDYHRAIIEKCLSPMRRTIGTHSFTDGELLWRTCPIVVGGAAYPSASGSEYIPLPRRVDALRILTLSAQRPGWQYRQHFLTDRYRSLLRTSSQERKLADVEMLARARQFDIQARNQKINSGNFNIERAVREQLARKNEPPPRSWQLYGDPEDPAIFDRLSAANQAAAALVLSIPIVLLFILGQRLKQHPGLAISLPLAAMAFATYTLSTQNEYLTVQCLSLIVGSIAGLFAPARKWLWILALPLFGSAGLCWLYYSAGYSPIYKPDELLINAIATAIGLAMCLPKTPVWLSWALSILMIGGVLFWMSQAWSVLGIIRLGNKEYLALAGTAALALVGPRTKLNGQALFSWVLFCASIAYAAFIVRFALSP